MTSAPAPRPRGSKKQAAKTKRPVVDTDDEYSEAQKPAVKKPKKIDPLPAREPSTRSTRGRRPPRPDAAEDAAPRRTAAQVAQENIEEDDRRRDAQFTRDVAVAAVAALQVEQDKAAALENNNAIMSIADLLPGGEDDADFDAAEFLAGHEPNSDLEFFLNYPRQGTARLEDSDSDSEFPLAVAEQKDAQAAKACVFNLFRVRINSYSSSEQRKARGKGKAPAKVPKVKKLQKGDLKAAIEDQYKYQQKKKHVQNRQVFTS
ncbi:hypothetical protein C8F04DRAFT_1254433 [Mycena alexandri]|uniref:Uncharacterized protein n=1 Tax=Mycena alexandri TaxID=1745969 RepID=A0AAD6XC92_9AGAR|nr:hypothetical protein C8F04DRAFT_1254433 [Mycena alexandri]